MLLKFFSPHVKMVSTDAEVYDVERIMQDRMYKGKKQYLIKWLGYPEEENTWEFEHNIFCQDLKDAYEEKKKATVDAREAKKKIAKNSKKSVKQNVTKAKEDRITITNEWDEVITTVLGVTRSSEGNLEVEYQTNDGKKGICDVAQIHKKAPLRLIEFYEKNLSFIE